MNPIDPSSAGESTVAARPIHDALPTPIAAAEVGAEGGGAVRPHVNDRLNSRVGLSLPDGDWVVQWTTDLARGLRADFVLHVTGRTVVKGTQLWQLFDPDGASLVVETMAENDIVLDPEHRLLYSSDIDGALNAYSLQDGSLAFTLDLLFGSEFDRVYTARRAQRVLVASVELPVDLHEPDPPKHALVEVHDLGEVVRTDDLDIVASSRLVGSTSWNEDLLYAAMNDDILVAATRGRIEQRSLDLSLLGALEAKFTPAALSLDEAGRVHMIVDVEGEDGQRRRALWVVTPAGEKAVDVELKTFAEASSAPPVIGYNHNIFLADDRTIRAFSAEGGELWSQQAGGPVAGLAVTADDQLLVTAGQLLSSYQTDGERRVLFVLDDGRWTTPPVLTDRGRILAATEKQLVCLTTQR
ncbi:MAG: hypothetical protein KJO98_05265 [Rhodothermia bacterium]|nr:hypothetical protein [Rhodothermia bacterium]